MMDASTAITSGGMMLAAVNIGDLNGFVQVGGTLLGSGLLIWGWVNAHRQIEERDKRLLKLTDMMVTKCSSCPLAKGANDLANKANEKLLHDDH